MKQIEKEVREIAKSHKFVPKTKWTSHHDETIRKYRGQVSIDGIVKIMKKMFPDDYFTYNSIAKRLSRRDKC
jgi:uncharacterized protein YutE (UPF0331/DUF86 family)